MPPKEGKNKKPKRKLRKFDLDYFGILTLTRYHGGPFEDFTFSGGGDKKGKKGGGAKGKKGKKKPAVIVPKLPMFPPVPEDPAKDAKKMRMRMKIKEEPDYIIPTTSIGFKEKTTRPVRPYEEGGSISDVMCGRRYPLPPRPQPHGGVYGNIKCLMCKSTNELTNTLFGNFNKKMKKLLNTEFNKAKFIIEWMTGRITHTLKQYEDNMKGILDEMGPVLDALDESEWDDHFEVRALIDKWRELQRELDRLRAELKQFRKNREEEIAKAVAEKLRELEEIERQMLALEKRIQEAMELLLDWQENSDAKIENAEGEIAATLELLRKIRESIFLERDMLRQLLAWEMAIATNNTVTVMEEIIRQDLDLILKWMHPAWYRLYLENRKMQEERTRLRMENHLLELEVETLARQVDQMESNEKEIESTRTHFMTPPTLNDRVDKFTRYYNNFAVVQLGDYPTTRLIHE